jgi:hypothetical protein
MVEKISFIFLNDKILLLNNFKNVLFIVKSLFGKKYSYSCCIKNEPTEKEKEWLSSLQENIYLGRVH